MWGGANKLLQPVLMCVLLLSLFLSCTEILGGRSGSEDSGSSGEESSEEEEEEEEETKLEIEDMTDAKLLTLRRNIYLTIMSSANFEECVHKLVKNLKEGTEVFKSMYLGYYILHYLHCT